MPKIRMISLVKYCEKYNKNYFVIQRMITKQNATFCVMNQTFKAYKDVNGHWQVPDICVTKG
jgi:hypothetical protein